MVAKFLRILQPLAEAVNLYSHHTGGNCHAFLKSESLVARLAGDIQTKLLTCS